MSLDNRKREVQLEAGEAWKNSGYRGCVELNTGGGKTFIAFDAMLILPKGSTVLFLAETTQREKDVIDDSKVYLSFFGVDPLSHVDFEFACYQSAYKWKGRHFDLVCCDELHDSLSSEYFKFYQNNTYERILGLSATIRSERTYIIKGKEVSKMDLLNQIAPICFTYGIADAQREGTGRKLDIHVIYHRLEEKRKDIVGGNKQNPFMISEKKQYDYLDGQFWKGVYSQQTYLIKGSMSKRAKLLYSLPSKVDAVKKLLKVVKGKTIIFNNDLDALELITPNVVSSPRNGRTKKEQDEFNSILRDKFDKGHIRTIASFKVLKQGANLKKLDNEILMSFDSNGGSMVQKWGRLRKNLEKIGNIFIFVTLNTQEEIWWKKATEDIPMEEFNVIRHMGIDECIKSLK